MAMPTTAIPMMSAPPIAPLHAEPRLARRTTARILATASGSASTTNSDTCVPPFRALARPVSHVRTI